MSDTYDDPFPDFGYGPDPDDDASTYDNPVPAPISAPPARQEAPAPRRHDQGEDEPGEGPEPEVEVSPLMLAQTLSELEQRTGDLETASGELQVMLDALVKMLEGQPGGPWLWAKLTPDQQLTLWTELGEWVEFLDRRYLTHLSSENYPLLPCWHKHPLAVELLTALMVSHQATYTTKQSTPTVALADWHLRYFVPVMNLLSQWGVLKHCTRGHNTIETYTRPPGHDRDAFTAWVYAQFPAEDITELPQEPAL